MWRESLLLSFLGCMWRTTWWSTNTSVVVGKAQQRLHFLRLLRKCDMDVHLLRSFYRSTTESVLIYCLTISYPGCTARDRKALQEVIKSVQQIIGCSLTSLEDIANTRGLNRTKKILSDPSHPGNGLFNLLLSGKRYRILGSRTNWFRSTFYPWAIRLLNT